MLALEAFLWFASFSWSKISNLLGLSCAAWCALQWLAQMAFSQIDGLDGVEEKNEVGRYRHQRKTANMA